MIICYNEEKDADLEEENKYAVESDENAEKEIIFKVCEVSIKDVTILQMRRPDYDKQLKSQEVILDEDTLIGATVEERCWYYFTQNLGLSDEAAADWFYYIEMGNPLGGTHGYGYEYTIPKRQAYAAAFYEALHNK